MDDYKIAFIYGVDDLTRGFQEGQIHLYGEVSKDYLHSKYLLDYVNEYYSDIPIFQKLNIRHPKEIFAYFLVKMGHVVFFNTTKYDAKSLDRYGKLGILMLPDNISNQQKESLLEFSRTIPDYDVLINYNLVMEGGLLDSQTFQNSEKVTPEENLQLFFSTVIDKEINSMSKK